MSPQDEITQDRSYQLTCRKCGRVNEITESQIARYLRVGWPACCGETMEFQEESAHDRPSA